MLSQSSNHSGPTASSLYHNFLQESKWTKVVYLQAGDQIAVANIDSSASPQNDNTRDLPVILNEAERSEESFGSIKFIKIKSITILPPERVYDIEVEGTHNFVANGIIAHNTAFNDDLTLSGNLNITGYASTTVGLFTLGEIRTASTLTADGNLLVNANATTTGSLNVDGDFLTDGTGSFASAAFTIDSSGNLTTTGYASSTTGLFTQGNGHIGGNASIDGTLDVLGLTTLTGFISNASSTIQGNFSVDGISTTTGRMYVGGNLGIGTTSPDYKLQVAGDIMPDSDNAYYFGTSSLRWKDINVGPGTINMWTRTGTNWEKGYLSFNDDVESDVFTIGTAEGGTGQVRDIQLKTGNNDGIYLNSSGYVGIGYTNPEATLAINGMVGIGTNNPTSHLDVLANGRATGDIKYGLRIVNTDTGNSQATRIGLIGNGSNSWMIGTDYGADNSNNFYIGTSTPDSTPPFGITANGNIYIGDTPEAGVTTNKLYSVDGSLYWNNFEIVSGGSSNYWTRTDSNMYLSTITNNIGIGTTTPDSKLTIIGRMHASSTGEQLRLTYDLESSKYGSFTIDTNGDLNIDLATSNSTTTISDNLSVLGYLNVEGNATTSGNQYIAKDLTVAGTASTTELNVQNNTHIGGDLDIEGNTGIGTSTPKYKLSIESNNSSDNLFQIATSTNQQILVIDNNGNVGIGTSSPTTEFKMEIAGSIGPGLDDTFDLGSPTKRWRDIYLGPASINLYSTYTDSDNYEFGSLSMTAADAENSDTDFDSADESSFTQEDLAYSVTLTPSATTGSGITLTLGSGNWNTTHKVKQGCRVVGNGGKADITATPAAQSTITASTTVDFTNTNAIASESWNIYCTDFDAAGAVEVGEYTFTAPTGGTITTDGSYTVHTFTSSGTFTVNGPMDVEYLVVAGGGGGTQCGGGNAGAGGGAGGMRYSASPGTADHAVTTQAYSITVGAGGAAGNSNGAVSGEDSVFDTITSTGGGAAHGTGGGYDGGSGGGAGSTTNNQGGGAGNTPSTSPIQGYGGGTNTASANYSSGGGGGRGGVGTDAVGAQSGSGGDGLANSITGSSITYSGGGGASGTNYSNESVEGAAGSGNGGAPGNVTTENATEPTANRGGGGSGGFLDMDNEEPDVYGLGSSGASGVVIIRYLTTDGVGITAPTNQTYTITTSDTNQLDSSEWTDINSGTITETLNSQTINYSVSFDDRTTWKVADTSETGWRSIVKNDSGTWKYNSNVTWGSETWTATATNTQSWAFDDAYDVGVVTAPTGGTITTDGDYTIHTFEENGTFTPGKSFDVEYLVVAGGGAGNGRSGKYAGGGGAGGYRTNGTYDYGVTAQAYSITVGAGGGGDNGDNSSFSTITSIGGGLGSLSSSGVLDFSGGNGGSGGGGPTYSETPGGDGTPGQGNDGGTGWSGAAAGGGGGAGAVGGSHTVSETGGDGGVGLSSSISGSGVYYAGGGGGGGWTGPSSGGNGGGGAGGGLSVLGVVGTVNTGGGGGGGGYGAGGGAGGSGIVIIRYLTSDAVQATGLNQMTGTKLNAITDTEWEAINGWNTSVDTIDFAMGLKTTSASQNPQVDSIVINQEGGGTRNELTFGTYADGTGSGRAIKFRTGLQNEGFYIGTDGNVGIGTTSPSQALSIQGSALADEWLTYSPMYTARALDSILSIDYVPGTEDGDWGDIEHNTLPQGIAVGESYMSINRLAVYNTKAIQEMLNILDISNAPTSTPSMYIDSNGNVGIGTTEPGYKLHVEGDTYTSGVYGSGGADYAEYFYTIDTDLTAGEAVCIDTTNNNAVKRCSRAADSNLMGVVSSNPSIVGNSQEGYENNSNYTIIGMLGQLSAKVSDENGVIQIGDSLTSASSTPGYLMKADAGHSTVGIAMSPLSSGTGNINVLIARKNKSLTIETVEEQITQHIADMALEDEVDALINNAVAELNLLTIDENGIVQVGSIMPLEDNLYNIGSSTNKFANIYGQNIIAGDLSFTETSSAVSGDSFSVGDVIALYVNSVDGGGAPSTIPIDFRSAINNTIYGSNDVWFNTTGNFGIGTSSPEGKLHLYKSTASGDERFITMQNYLASGNLSYNTQIDVTTGDFFLTSNDDSQGSLINNAYSAWSMALGGANDYWGIKRSPNSSLSYTDLFRIQSDGNIGIGTTTPGSLLTVDGSFAVGTNGTEFIIDSLGNASSTFLYASGDITSGGNFTGNLIGNVTGNLTGNADTATNLADYSSNYTWTGINTYTSDVRATGTLHATTTDFDSLQVNGSATTTGSHYIGGTASTTELNIQNNTHIGGDLDIEGNTGIGTSTPKYKLSIESNNSSDNLFQIATSTNQQILVIDNNGNVGIGTSSPTTEFKMEIAGSIGPGLDDTFDLGSPTKRWQDIYLGPASINLYSTYTDTSNYEFGSLSMTSADVTNSDTDFDSADESAFIQEDLAYSVTLTPSATTGSGITLTLGSGNWNTTHKVKAGCRVVGNGGKADITATPAAQSTITASTTVDFTNTDAIGSGSWNIYCTDFDSSGKVEMSEYVATAPTGGTITTDGSYTVHTFTSSGTFTPGKSFDVEYLVVGGGGGGGSSLDGHGGGGGGAGGMLKNAAYDHPVTEQAYTITVGGGGAAGANGNNSVFDTFTSVAGGLGGDGSNVGTDRQGASGGSGGGSGGSNTTALDGGLGTSEQGNNGGAGAQASGASGSGGGAGGAGTNGGEVAGGIGLASSITGSSVTYAAGGGTRTDTAGPVNTGNGGGGAYSNTSTAAGAGGSGIVIIRYLTSDGTGTLPTSERYTITTSDTNQLDSSEWTDINSGTITETLNSQTINYAVSFDDRTTWKVADTSETGWRSIVKYDSVWKYNSNVTWGSETWTATATNTQAWALDDAYDVAANVMTGTKLNAITDTEWESANGWNTSVDTIDFAMGLYTDSASQNPQVDSIYIDHEGGGTRNELTFGTYADGSGSGRAIKFRTGQQNEGFYIGTDGNVGIGTTGPTRSFFVSGDSGGTTAWSNDSHSSYKEEYEDVSVLPGISELDIKEWQFKISHYDEGGVRHISPFSEDFRDKFGLGGSDYTIQALDVAGVALKGVQELNTKIDDLAWSSSTIAEYIANTYYTTTTQEYITNIIQGISTSSAQLLIDEALVGYVTDYTETDPIFTISEAGKITVASTTNWITAADLAGQAYNWGDHSEAGYITMAELNSAIDAIEVTSTTTNNYYADYYATTTEEYITNNYITYEYNTASSTNWDITTNWVNDNSSTLDNIISGTYTGDSVSATNINAISNLCIDGDCKTSWSDVSVGIDWTGTTTVNSLIPGSDNTYTIGSPTNRFSNVYGNVLTAGDLAWTETTSAVSGDSFLAGGIIAMYINSVDGGGAPNTIPIDFRSAINNTIYGSNNIWFNTTGNVGIGLATTTDPTGKLHLYKSTASGDERFLTMQNYLASGNLSYNTQIDVTTGDFFLTSNDDSQGSLINNAYSAWSMALGGANDYWGIKRSPTGSLSYTDLFRIQSDGNIGIGTTTPGSLLTVDGSFAVGTNGTEFIIDSLGNASSTFLYASGDITSGGNFTGNLIGNVTGNLTGNADTATNLADYSSNYTWTGINTFTSDVRATGTLHATTTDFDSLQVNGSATTTGSHYIGGTASTTELNVQDDTHIGGDLDIEGNIGIGTSTPKYKLSIESNNSSDNLFQIATSTNQQVLVIDNNGNVGIGTSSPTTEFKMEIAGSIGPGLDDTFDLGSPTKRWQDIYLGPASINLYSTYTDTSNYEFGSLSMTSVDVTNSDTDFDSADESSFTQEDFAYSVTLTPSAVTGSGITLTLGSGNWNTTHKVKQGCRVVGNGGKADITTTPAAQSTITASTTVDFTNTDAIASESWNIYCTDFDSAGKVEMSERIISAPTGGTITTDGDYTIHTFTEDGTFTVYNSFDVEYLVVGGGGGGGGSQSGEGGGGGGAGGLVYNASHTVTEQAYSVTTGAGGAGGAVDSSSPGINGDNSVFDGVTALGGGGGGYGNSPGEDGHSGGSGGGAGGSSNSTTYGASGQQGDSGGGTGFGNDGGDDSSGGYGGAGGGAGGAAVTRTPGIGKEYSITGSAVTYATGGNEYGGGGAGGVSTSQAGVSGTANTGGGGGGAYYTGTGGSGGSGVVIIRYLTTDGAGTAAPTDQTYTITTSDTNQLDSSEWTDINSGTITETLNSQTINYAVSFDDRTTWKVADTSETGWRSIVKNDGGTWKYNSNETWGSETWTAVATNTQSWALDDAYDVAANVMTGTKLNNITDTEWEATGGWSTSVNTIDFAMGLKTTSASQNPQVDSIYIDHEGGGTRNELTFGTYADGTGSGRAIKFRTGLQNEGFYIGSTGNVGIGTTSPSQALSIQGSALADEWLTYSPMYGGRALDSILSISCIPNTEEGDWCDIEHSTLPQGIAVGDDYMSIGRLAVYNTKAIQEILNIVNIQNAPTSTPSMYINPDGNIGIGTETPESLLSLYNSEDDTLLSFGNNQSNTAHWFMGADYFDDNKFKIATSSSELQVAEFTINKDGNIGIGTTTPIAALSIQTNFVDSTPAMTIHNASSTSMLTLLNNGNFGIATTTPTNILTIGQGRGNAIADGWDVYSSEDYKTDITYLEEEDYDDILDEIEALNTATYNWKDSSNEGLEENKNFGVIAEEAPERVLAEDGKSVSLYDYATFAIAGVKAVKNEVDELKDLLGVIENEDGSLSMAEEESRTFLEQGTSLSGLTIDTDGYAVIDKIKSKIIKTEELEIKAENAMQSGITIYDTKTGSPYCLYTEYGVPTTRSGECSVVLEGIEPIIEPELIPEEEVIIDVILNDSEGSIIDSSAEPQNDSIEEPESEPEPVATTTPEIIVEEPVVEETSTSTISVIID